VDGLLIGAFFAISEIDGVMVALSVMGHEISSVCFTLEIVLLPIMKKKTDKFLKLKFFEKLFFRFF